MKNYDVPILVYHSVGIPNKKWNWNYLTCPYPLFEKHLKILKKRGYQTISLKDLHGYMMNGKPIPKKSIVITFDDGYVDNWIFAYPLLEKYDMCGTVFINPEFVDKRDIKRPLFPSIDKYNENEITGFLSWNEIKEMDKRGIIYSESHALTHTWYPISGKILDFRYFNDKHIWMTWNDNVDRKPKLQIDDHELIKLGAPVYESAKSLLAKRYFPDIDFENEIFRFIEQNGGQVFFKKEDWKDQLFQFVNRFRKDNILNDCYENDFSYQARIKFELLESKNILEQKLEKEITFLCWPGGSASEVGMRIAKSLGYNFFNSARDLDSVQRKKIKNVLKGGDRVKRFAPYFYWDGQEDQNSKIVYSNGFWLDLMLVRYSNKFWSKYWYWILIGFFQFAFKMKYQYHTK